MTLAMATDGWLSSGGGAGSAPIISAITPAEAIEPGEPGAFSATFKTARLTPITFHLAEVSEDAVITIAVKFENRNETYVARGVDGEWNWPFDITADNFITALVDGECDVEMLPRGGWPPTVINFAVSSSVQAAPP